MTAEQTNMTETLTQHDSNRREGLSFAYPHFLFFNFRAAAQMAHWGLPDTQDDPSKNPKSHFSQRFDSSNYYLS